MKLRFQIKDFFELMKQHRERFEILARQPALYERAEFHDDTADRYEIRVEKFLRECEYLYDKLGMVSNKMKKTSKLMKRKSLITRMDTQFDKPVTMVDRIIKLNIMTQVEVDLLDKGSDGFVLIQHLPEEASEEKVKEVQVKQPRKRKQMSSKDFMMTLEQKKQMKMAKKK